MVIIKEDNVPVMQWPLGRILKTYQGNDGKVRVVDLKTASGISRRAITRLAPLFHEDEEETPARETLKNRPLPTDEAETVPPKKLKQDEIPSRNQKPIKNSTLVTMLITLLLIPAVISSNIHISKFRTDPGQIQI